MDATNGKNGGRQNGKLHSLLRSLHSRNYRLFFAGQLVSLIGTWMAQVAMSWLVYQLTGSKILLGTVAFASQIPGFVLGPWAGVMVDRWNLRRALALTQTFSMLQALAVAGLTLAGVITTGQIVALALILGMINAFDMPARQSFVVQLVERREDLANAIALNSTMFNASRLVGPTVFGLVLVGLGEYLPNSSMFLRLGLCFLANGLSFIAVIIALLSMRLSPRDKSPHSTGALGELREGWRYAFGSLPIRMLLVNLAVISLLGTPYTVLLPVFAQDVLHGGEGTLGMLTASIGCGALLGGLRLAARKSVLGLGRWIAIGATLMGVSLIAFSISRTMWLSAPILACCGFAMITQMASSNTVLQTIVDDDKRGRVMALYGMAFLGMMPMGSLMAGFLAERAGAPMTVALSGIVCIVTGTWFWSMLPQLSEHIRPIYEKRGILTPVAAGLQQAQSQDSDRRMMG
jgi:MFS family permease